MKIRRGFVSNSSTTSFCIYGTYLENDNDMLKKACKIAKIKYDPENADCEIYEDLIKDTGIEYHSGPEGDGNYLGISLPNMKDDETFRAFKKRISDKLAEIFGEPMKCSVMEEAWRDG